MTTNLKFRKKPVVIEAWRIDFANKPLPKWVNDAFATDAIDWSPDGEGLYINTREGCMRGQNDDMLIRGVRGELYACKPDIFEATYEPVVEDATAQTTYPLLPWGHEHLVALREAHLIAGASPDVPDHIADANKMVLQDQSGDATEKVGAPTAQDEYPHTAPTMTQGLPYGIIDPDYARVYTIARVLAWSKGYALAMHGSFTRDLDLLAVPWADHACDPEHLVRRIEDATGLKLTRHPPGEKPHGRRAWTLLFPAFSDPRFVDISVMPRQPLPAAPKGGA